MLFSNPEIATYINENFEPVWQSVRPVPLLKVDFGNGNVVTRTLQGNIATYVCSPKGIVIDALPGIYDASTYKELLGALHQAALSVTPTSDSLRAYHHSHSDELRKAIAFNNVGRFLGVIGNENVGSANHADQTERDEELRKTLKEDSRLNRTVWRLATHELLASAGKCRPEEINKRFYREILQTDLDDPYLGLADTLFCAR